MITRRNLFVSIAAMGLVGCESLRGSSQQSSMGQSQGLGTPRGGAPLAPSAPANQPVALTPASASTTSATERSRSYCKPGENCWARVGANPFTGTIDDYLKHKDANAPAWAKAQWRDQVVGNRFRTVSMPDGALYRDQIYSANGDHRIWKNVRQAVGRTLRGPLYKAEQGGVVHYLFLPAKSDGGCDNFSWLADESVSLIR
jgi:hypothetical protein